MLQIVISPLQLPCDTHCHVVRWSHDC